MKVLAAMALLAWMAAFWAASISRRHNSGPIAGWLLVVTNVALAVSELIR
jgi:hypothetical protein